MTLEGLHNQKICAGEYQPQVTLAKNRKNRKEYVNIHNVMNEQEKYRSYNQQVLQVDHSTFL